MTHATPTRTVATLAFVMLLAAVGYAQAAIPPGPPADPWPRPADLSNAAVLLYQPQVQSWNGDIITFRAAVAIKPAGAKDETFGAIFATARAQTDRNMRTVQLSSFAITRHQFPTLPDNGDAYTAEMQAKFATALKTISLDRLEASLALLRIKPPALVVRNDP